jgi:hypothetical protein
MSAYAFAWRDRVADPDWLVWCRCRHAEQIHGENHGACTAGAVGVRCMCDAFVEERREWVGFGDAG